MLCKCYAMLMVVDSRPATVDNRTAGLPSTETVWRRRECRNGHRRDTIEIPIGPTLRYRVHPRWPEAAPKEAVNGL